MLSDGTDPLVGLSPSSPRSYYALRDTVLNALDLLIPSYLLPNDPTKTRDQKTRAQIQTRGPFHPLRVQGELGEPASNRQLYRKGTPTFILSVILIRHQKETEVARSSQRSKKKIVSDNGPLL